MTDLVEPSEAAEPTRLPQSAESESTERVGLTGQSELPEIENSADSADTTDSTLSPKRVSPAHKRPARRALLFFRDLAIIVVIALGISFVVKSYLVRSFYIPSASMENTLKIDDRILVEQLTGKVLDIHRGDILVFKDPGGWLKGTPVKLPERNGMSWLTDLIGITAPDDGDHLIKRVLGLPGDQVACCNGFGQLTINGVPINESGYVILPPGITKVSAIDFNVTVPPGQLWMLGDNRYNSGDSRYNQLGPGSGFVPIENVVGRAILITWPVERWAWLDNHQDLFRNLDLGDSDVNQNPEAPSEQPSDQSTAPATPVP
ncbi:MAG: signal peptidase I [Microbacteriaceae bacterium]